LKRKNKQGLNENRLTSLKYLDGYRGGSKGGQAGPEPPLQDILISLLLGN